MGTLFNQNPRSYFEVDDKDVANQIKTIKRIANSNDLTFDQVLRVYENLEHKRQNNVFVSNGDIHDEQMAGIGELLKDANYQFTCLTDMLEEKLTKE